MFQHYLTKVAKLQTRQYHLSVLYELSHICQVYISGVELIKTFVRLDILTPLKMTITILRVTPCCFVDRPLQNVGKNLPQHKAP
jgi:hypothetical protein